MCEELYYDDCIYLNRKYDLVKVIKSWVRPEGMIISPKKCGHQNKMNLY